MASIFVLAGGKYRASVAVRGKRATRIFRTRREATAWAAAKETEFHKEITLPIAQRRSFADLIVRYIKEVSPTKRGGKHEALRMTALMRDNPFLASTILSDLTPQHFADLRDLRLLRVKPSSVIRELTALSSALECARREWRWIDNNPLRDIRKPAHPRHRERTLSPWEIRTMLKAAKYRPGSICTTKTNAVARAMLLAICTGMRAGEICALRWEDVRDRYVILHTSKTGQGRDVPLSRQARRVINDLRGWNKSHVVGLTPASLDALFRKLRKQAGLSGFTFHDTRHTAATMLARKLDVLDLCKMFGWSSTTRALTYYNPKASDIAGRLE